MARLLADTTPLRESAPFRRLWWGQGLASIGGQFTAMAVSLEVYAVTGSTFMVGLLGVFILVPLVIMGLYGGSIIDRHDRRVVALVASVVLWLTTVGLAVAAWNHWDNVWLLYILVAAQSAASAVNSPARTAILPRLVDRRLLPAANALNSATWTIAQMVGPLLGAVVVAGFGFKTAYTIDAVTFTAALYALFRLPPAKPLPTEGSGRPMRGWRSVLDGFRFLATRRNVRMTFFIDLAAMVFAQPVALYPAIATDMIGGGATTVGWLTAAVAIGSVIALVFSGPLGRVRRQGLVIAVMVVGWGASIAGFGAVLMVVGSHHPRVVVWWALIAACGLLAVAGAFDAVSSVFRNTILQAATPDALQGRLQGIFTVTVSGGPNLGKVLTGTMAKGLGTVSAVPLGWTALVGGGLCVVAVGVLMRAEPGFARYDARTPVA